MGVVYADVVARVQERAAKAAADELRKQFAEVGEHLGKDTSDKFDGSLRSLLPKVAQQAGVEFMAGFKDEITSQMPGVSQSMLHLSGIMKTVGADGAAGGLAAAAGVAAITVAAVKAGEALYGVGQRFDAVFDGVAIRTGKAGDDLDALTASIQNVANSTASSIEQIGDIGARISQSFGMSGAPLEGLTKQVADLNRMTGESLNVRDFGMMLRGFGEDSSQAGADLDALTAASQRTGAPVNELISAMKDLGPAARTLGLDINQTAGYIDAFDKAGIDASGTVTGLNKAAAAFAGHNIDLKTGLQDTITQIRGFIDAGNEAAALDLAGKVFGTKSAEKFVDAIRQGTLSVDDLKSGLGDTGGTISKLNDQTSDWSEQWKILKNRIEDIKEYLGGPFFAALNKALGALNDILSPKNAYPTVAPSWSAPGSPLTPSQIIGGPPPSNTPNSLNGILLPSDSAVPGQVIPPWMPQPDTAHTPQDIAGALAAKAGAASTSLPSAPQLPYDPAYGQPPSAGETMQQWQARMANIAAQHDLAEKQARATQLEHDTNATAEDVTAAHNAVIESSMRAWQADQAFRKAQLGETQGKAKVSVPYDPAYGQGPRPGETAQQYSAESSYMDAAHSRAQAQAELQAMQATGTASAAELGEAQNKLVKARNEEITAQMRLVDASGQASKTLGDVGAKIDADFGISKGLPGIVENITKFLGNLALAPALSALGAVSLANGGAGSGGASGSGLSAIIGSALGMGQTATASAGAYPFGAPGYAQAPGYMPNATVSYAQSGSAGTYPLPGGYAPMGNPYGSVPSGMGGAYPGDAALLAQVPKGGHYDASGDLSKGLADCTSGIEDLVNMMDGRPTAGREMNTNSDYGGNAGTWLTQHGFMPTSAPVPGAFNVGYNHHHMEGTLPGGTNVNYGSDASVASGGTAGAAGAFGDPSFTSHYYRPVGAGPTPSPAWNSTWAGGGGSGGGASGGASAPSVRPAWGLAGGPANQAAGSPHGGGAGTGAGFPGMAGVPQGIPGAFAAASGPADPSQSVIGGRAYGQGSSASGGLGFGGGLAGMAGSAISGAAGLATSGAAMGMDGGMGGAAVSAITQIGIQEAQRAIGAGAQYEGALAGGLLETFSLNDSALGDPSKSWLGKIGGAIAGIRPSLPNSAGKEGGAANPNMAEAGKKVDAPGPLTPQQAADQKAADAANNGGKGGPGNGTTINNNVNVTNQKASEDYTGQVVQAHLGAQAMAGLPR